MTPKSMRDFERKLDKERIKEKDSDLLKVIESVFDFQTSMLLVKLMNKGVLENINFVISTGKEANVYHGEMVDGREVAIKIYRTATAEFKRNWMYVQGDPRFKGYKKGTYSFIYTWAKKEFKNLKRMTTAGINVPEPLHVQKNILIMGFIGKNQQAAPLLKDVELKKPEKIYSTVIDAMEKMHEEAKLVHADLSEYNILYFEKKPIIIDVSQSVLLSHPQAAFFLYRDVKNINRYFKSLGVETLSNEELYEHITKSKLDPRLQLSDL
ncbi:MAG: serine protein kinase RIO [Candidatus Heimdallarchaeaceae archaeon]